ncbi:uncharacterized protein, partial [Pocillopora verrucosa]|uniref:uncharacterized protein n=1 Tax=Pocillopora verrucosa TaxID=203993 RepID=UPI00334218C2
MTCIEKILLAIVIVQVACVMAKHIHREDEFSPDDGTYSSLRKRAADCGSGAETEGTYSRKCRSKCKTGELSISIPANLAMCSGK